MKYLLILLALMTAACSDGGSSKPASKNLFSVWTSTSDGSVLDLTGLSNGAHPIRLAFTPNSGCDCTLDIFGDQSQGTANLINCTQYGPGSYCAGIEDLYGYANSTATLALCGSNGCDEYK
jgi:hypothetical protein